MQSDRELAKHNLNLQRKIEEYEKLLEEEKKDKENKGKYASKFTNFRLKTLKFQT